MHRPPAWPGGRRTGPESLAFLPRLGGRCRRRRCRRVRIVVVEAIFLYGNDVVGGELVLVLLVVVETNGAPFGTDSGQHLRGLQDVVGLGVALDDRHLVIVVIAIGDRHRVGRGAAQQEPDHNARKPHRRDRTQRVHPSSLVTSSSSWRLSSSRSSSPSSPSLLCPSMSHPNRVRAVSM